jgi:hypothetical protein
MLGPHDCHTRRRLKIVNPVAANYSFTAPVIAET